MSGPHSNLLQLKVQEFSIVCVCQKWGNLNTEKKFLYLPFRDETRVTLGSD